MKTFLLKLNFGLIAMVLFSCNKDCNPIAISLDEVYTQRGSAHSICDSTHAVLTNRSIYDTQKGSATLYIPVPTGHSIAKSKQSEKSVSFVTRGKDFPKTFTLYKVELAGFAKAKGDSIHVDVTMEYNGVDHCKGVTVKAEKKKNSVVNGTPLHQYAAKKRINESILTNKKSKKGDLSYDMCNAPYSLIGCSLYNTTSGTAIVNFAYPEGHNLKFVKQNGNTVEYKTEGNNKPTTYIEELRTITGLSTKECSKLTVFLEIDDRAWKKCETTDPKKTKKKKESVVDGSPFIGCQELN